MLLKEYHRCGITGKPSLDLLVSAAARSLGPVTVRSRLPTGTGTPSHQKSDPHHSTYGGLRSGGTRKGNPPDPPSERGGKSSRAPEPNFPPLSEGGLSHWLCCVRNP